MGRHAHRPRRSHHGRLDRRLRLASRLPAQEGTPVRDATAGDPVGARGTRAAFGGGHAEGVWEERGAYGWRVCEGDEE